MKKFSGKSDGVRAEALTNQLKEAIVYKLFRIYSCKGKPIVRWGRSGVKPPESRLHQAGAKPRVPARFSQDSLVADSRSR